MPEPTFLQGQKALAARSTGAIVKGVLHTGSLTLIYGAPKSGKSFLTTDLLVSIAAGADDWLGHKIVKPGYVIYLTCEGHSGFWKRLQAIALHRWGRLDHFPEQFILGVGRPTFIQISNKNLALPRTEDIEKALDRYAKLGITPTALAIDTVFRSFAPGNVNSSDHMMAYVEAVQRIADRGTGVALVHHATKSAATPAGSVSLIGACDTLVFVDARDNGDHTWEVEMAKDDGETPPRAFKLEPISIGQDPDGVEASSCVVVDLNQTEDKPKGRPKKLNERELLIRLLIELLDDKPQRPNGGVPPMIDKVALIDDWRALFMFRCRPDDEDKTKVQAFRRMVVDLQGANRIGVAGKQVWVI